jgi:hypothetical protein
MAKSQLVFFIGPLLSELVVVVDMQLRLVLYQFMIQWTSQDPLDVLFVALGIDRINLKKTSMY